MLCWEWHYENYIMLKFFQVITYQVYNGFENDMIMTSEYQVRTEFETHLSAHDGLRWKSGTRKKQIINKLLAEGSDLLYLWSFACDINWKSLY